MDEPDTTRQAAGTETGPSTGAPLVYFICLGNAMRSQMAEAFLRKHAGEAYVAASGGTHPLGHVLPEVIRTMRERGIDLSAHNSTGLDVALIARARHIVDLGGAARTQLPEEATHRLVEWRVTDPYGLGQKTLEQVRDEIERRILDWLKEQAPQGAPPAGPD